jgi:surface polysaccharide O-acyltransferase-like enzyme
MLQTNAPKVYHPHIDALRLISILAVIMIHTTTRSIESTFMNLKIQTFCLFLNQSARFAVPLFFMISGYVLELSFQNNPNILVYLKKRISRIFVPYLFWSVIYYFFVYTKHNVNFPMALLTGSASYQLYFIPALILFYGIFPIIHRYVSFFSKWWAIVILTFGEVAILSADYYFRSVNVFYPIGIGLFNFLPFIIGLIAAHHSQHLFTLINKYKLHLFSATAILMFFVFFEGRTKYLSDYNYLSFYSQWRPSIFFYTIFLAASGYYVFNKIPLNQKLVKTLADSSFLVFFTHIIVLELVWKYVGKAIFYTSWLHAASSIWFDPLFFLVVTVISFFSAWQIHKIKIITKIIG